MRPRYVIAHSTFGSIVFGFVVFEGIGSGDCRTDVFAALVSPDGRHKAIIFGIGCGATTGFNTQLSILPAAAAFARDVYPPQLNLDGKWTFAMRWKDDVGLVVAIPKTVRIYKQEERTGEVSISY